MKPLSLLCVVEDPAVSPSSRLRILKHLDALRAEGIEPEVIIQPGAKDRAGWRELFLRASAFDAVLWQKALMSPWRAFRLKRAGRKLLYDIDDAVWMGKRNHVPYRSGKQARRFWCLAKLIDGALCGSPVLEGKIREVSRRVMTRQIPTSVPRVSGNPERVNGIPVVVWVGMGPNVAQVEAIETELAAAHGARPFLLRIVSDRPPVFGTFSSWEFIPWSAEAEYVSISSADLGIMPLVDDGFTRGKCAYKALQYMACGLPVIASDVGVNREWIAGTGSGCVVSPGNWAGALVGMLADPAGRTRFGEAGREAVRERFSDEVIGRRFAVAVREMIESA